MAPAQAATRSEDADMLFILNIVAACYEYKFSAQVVAKADGINHASNVYPKLHKILKTHSLKCENKRIMRDEGYQTVDEAGSATDVKKSATKKKAVEDCDEAPAPVLLSITLETKPKAKMTPKPKKCKLEEVAEADVRNSNGSGAKGTDEKDGVEIEDNEEARAE